MQKIVATLSISILMLGAGVASAQSCPNIVHGCTIEHQIYSCGPLPRPPGPGGVAPAACTDGHCEPGSISYEPAGFPCPDDGNPCTTDLCDGTATCAHANPSGGKQCGSACVPQTTCCTDADCSSIDNPTNHQHGVCTASGCALACDATYKACGTTCIAMTTCCSSTDCTTPPSACYQTQGTCGAGTCSYAFADGASCNADSNACTPNDSCSSGKCVADTAHTVKCVQRDCHSAPACNPSTGNCEDTASTDGAACGGNGCTTTTGMCASGTCSAPPTVSCPSTNPCQVGACDASGKVGAPCTTSNVVNGTSCAVTNRCILNSMCSGGDCVGTSKACTASGACRTSACDSTSGDCVETVATAGTTCSIEGSCQHDAICDDSGNCKGDPVPDGTPCDKQGCTSASCDNGTCSCTVAPDFGAATATDSGVTITKPKSKGCSTMPGSEGSGLYGFLLSIFFVCAARRRYAS